jgi:hypothetical protein
MAQDQFKQQPTRKKRSPMRDFGKSAYAGQHLQISQPVMKEKSDER